MRIFGVTETDFTGYGLGPLPDALEAQITEELNGEFTLSLTYPAEGFNADKLVTGNIIFTQSRPSDTVGEPFRINTVEDDIEGVKKVAAEHASYDMNYIVFTGQINQTVTGIVNACNALNNYRTGNGFVRIWYDGIDTSDPKEFNIGKICMLSEAFANGDESLVKTFDGEVRYQYRPDLQKELVYICDRRGVDRDIDIAYGFNMLGFIEPTEIHYKDILAELEEKDIIKYRGSLKDIKPFVAASHATIHPSTYGEGMSNVLLESASSGRPIISTDNPGCMETFVDGETGFIYHGGDVDALCEQIRKFLALPNEERKAMGEKGREYIKANFSRDIVIKAYLEKINSLCK
mgnify:CR=1 FL=1